MTSPWILSDKRVQSIGRDIAKAIHGAINTSRITLLKEVTLALKSRREEMVEIRSEMVPDSLLPLWRHGLKWALTLSKENIQAIRGGSGTFSASASSLGSMADMKGKSFAILGGVR